jgi:hypothetical protein
MANIAFTSSATLAILNRRYRQVAAQDTLVTEMIRVILDAVPVIPGATPAEKANMK